MDVERFRTEALEFLQANAKPRQAETAASWGEGSDKVGLFRELTAEQEVAELEAARTWRRTLDDAGYAWISGPTEYGGAGLPRSFERQFAAAEAGFDTPVQGMLGIGLHMVGPTLLTHGSDEARSTYLAPLRRADLVACQLFSEPGAGSDLAGVSTRAAQLDNGAWTITGAKVWTSHARHADIGLVLCRTDPAAPKHRGMTAFVVDMHHPGVKVRPLRQMTGGATFNSVTLDEVRVPDVDRVGEVGEGWTVARTTLANERASIGESGRRDQLSTARLVDLIAHSGRADDVVRQRFAQLYIRTKAVSMTGRRAAAGARAGSAGAEASVLKLSRSANLRLLSDLLADVLGERLAADTGEWGTFAWSELVLGVPGTRLGGGSDEIQRSVIGERVLGLPKEPEPGRGR